MKRRRRTRKALKFTLVVIAVFIIGLAAWLAFVADIQLNDLRSLVTVRRVDDYPLCVMRYCGDYDLKDFQTGRGLKGVWKWGCEQLKPRSTGAMSGCFSAMNKQTDRILGRNYDWPNTKAALLSFTTDFSLVFMGE